MNNSSQLEYLKFGPGDARKIIILLQIAGAVYCKSIDLLPDSFYWILSALVFIYALDLFYTITVTQRTTNELKAFMFQTAVPVFALSTTGIVALIGDFDSSSIVTMFGLSLAYTTYVVGRPVSTKQEESVNTDEQKSG